MNLNPNWSGKGIFDDLYDEVVEMLLAVKRIDKRSLGFHLSDARGECIKNIEMFTFREGYKLALKFFKIAHVSVYI